MADHQARLAEGAEFLYREARCLDERRWDDWLDLYIEACEFWAPASLSPSDVRFTTDPRREVSLIYYDHRQGLRDRVSRIGADDAYAVHPMHRTCHAISNIMLDEADDTHMVLAASWRVDFYRKRESGYFFGHYRHELVRADGEWKIAKKTVYVLNDYIPTMLEIHQI